MGRLYHAASQRLPNSLEHELAVGATECSRERRACVRNTSLQICSLNLEYVTVSAPFSGHFVTHVIGSSNTLPL
jgi:hypothetical protein